MDEFQKNVGSLREGLSRTRGESTLINDDALLLCWTSTILISFFSILLPENALLREKMAGLSEEEIQRAIDGQNKREKAKNKKDAWME